MKTEQGLQIAEILFDKSYGDVSEYKNRFEVADKVLTETREKLIKAEHDRDRYKAEIKRLKEAIEVFKNDTECNLNHITVENGQLKAKNKILKDGVVKAFTNGFNTGREQVEKDIRRAKIEALNKAKKRSYCDNDFMDGKWHRYVLVSDIDELIKEVEDDK